jgi:ArsR family transcriptional regulator
MKAATKASPKKPACKKINARIFPGEDDAGLASLADALGHPARVAIIRLLKEREVCVCGEIVEVLPLAQSTVSQHLKVLKAAGWIQGEIDGPRVCYYLDPDALEKFKTLITAL